MSLDLNVARQLLENIQFAPLLCADSLCCFPWPNDANYQIGNSDGLIIEGSCPYLENHTYVKDGRLNI